VTSPFTAEFSASGFELAPATSTDEGAGHLHWSTDSCDLDSQLEGGEASVEIELAPGEHTICVGAFTSGHEPLGGTAQITVIVDGASGVGTGTNTDTDEAAAERWEATIDGDIKAGPDCTGAKNIGGFVLDVAEDGSVAGNGSVDSTEYTCTTPQGTSTIPPGTSAFTIIGTKGDDAFELTFSTGGLTMEIPYEGGSGSADVDQSVGDYIATSHVEITCVEGC
jgi:hypothetical protein